MTVKELKELCERYIKSDPPDNWMLNDVDLDCKAYKTRCRDRENHKVVFCQNEPSKKMIVTSGCSDFLEHKVVKTEKKVWKPNSDMSPIPLAYCSECKNFIKGSRNAEGGRGTTISCNNPRLGRVIKQVYEYIGSQCIDYDPVKPVYVENQDVEKTSSENVLMLFSDKEVEG